MFKQSIVPFKTVFMATLLITSFVQAKSYQILVKMTKDVKVYGFAVGEYQGRTMNMNVACVAKDQNNCMLEFPTEHQGQKILKSASLIFDSVNSGALIETIGMRAVKIPIVEGTGGSENSRTTVKFNMVQMAEHGIHPTLQCESADLIKSGIAVDQNGLAMVDLILTNSCE